MIRCEDVLREIPEYLDDEITPELRMQIELHTCKCRPCKVLISTTQMTLTLVSDDSFRELPQGVSGRLLQRLKKHST